MAKLSQLTIPVKNSSTGRVTPQTFDLSGSDSGGHTIQNQSGTTMTQRTNLKFNNATVVDDPINDATVVTPTGDPTNFVGTIEEWEALSQAEQDMYDSVDLIDDYTDVTDEIDELNAEIQDLQTRREIVNQSGYVLEAIGDIRILHMNGCGVGTSDNITSLIGSENLPKCAVTVDCLAVGMETPCAVLLNVNGAILIVGMNGTALTFPVVVDATLTWIV